MLLRSIIQQYPELEAKNLSLDTEIFGITYDNRKIQSHWIFAALSGQNQHGANFAPAAIQAGANVILTDANGAKIVPDLPLLVAENPRKMMGLLANTLSDDAQSKLHKFGVTGTNGKTTTSYMIYAMLEALEQKPSLIGTVGIRVAGTEIPSTRTTPESADLHQLMSQAAAAGSRSLAMEVSSHAIELHRISGIHYQVAVFTGLSQDHLDFHLTMENYFAAKARLFTPEFAEAGVVCVDDDWGRRLAGSASIPLTTYAVSTDADWTAKSIQRNQDGTVDFVAVNSGHELPIRLAMPGDFNVANALAALASIQTAGFNLELAATALASIAVPGRVERIEAGQPFVVLVDYAHTPDAVERALKVAHTCTNQDVISVLGCGGDRDKTKRPQMGKAAAEQSYLVVTDDNPRSEVPATIRAEVLAGVPQSARAIEIADRKLAIKHAMEIAKPGDCVIILGKGHERGQEISGIVQPFDDREIAREILREIYG